MPSSIRDGASVITRVLEAAGKRPESDDEASSKGQYAVRFADAMAREFVTDLRRVFPGIEATASRTAGSHAGRKQLDVNYSTSGYGLMLGISFKSVHIPEAGGRFTHNMKRNDEELRTEASSYHKRQPYAVMVAVLFLPFTACDDARSSTTPSSFGSYVKKLHSLSGRSDPRDDHDRFEGVFVSLYDEDGSNLAFFDVRHPPPKQGRPRELLSYEGFITCLRDLYVVRNEPPFRWADTEEPLEVGLPDEAGAEESPEG